MTLASEMLTEYRAEYDGPEFPHLGDWAEAEYPHLTDDEFFKAVEEAERLAAIESYTFAFNRRPRLNAEGWPIR